MVAHVSERKAIRAIFGYNKSTALWTDWADLKFGLAELGVRTKKRARRVTNWEAVPRLAIVGLGRFNRAPVLHWVVYDPRSDLVYDPMKSKPLPRQRFRRQPISYLGVGGKRTPDR